ncbi:MAG: polyphosphate kinase 2 family protein [Nocardioidaceae bacterium]|nr:polyphosphate kinase 2 family protein [Nocardioidaceae bacterium]
MTSLSTTLRVQPGTVALAGRDSREILGFDGGKDEGKAAMADLAPRLEDLQERLYAAGRASSDHRRLLLVLQGMDTAGKGGVVKHAVGLLDPQGVRITSFGKPTPEELEHDFLWRIEKGVPGPGTVGIFDRSHYEDVLIGRVRQLAPPEEIESRYDAINAFEQRLVDDGVTIVKCFLHISPDDQRDRLLARLDDPTKHWKFNPADIDERQLWDAYAEAYAIALERTSTDAAPWHVVPSGRKWYRNWAVARLLTEHLEALDLPWPAADFDVEEQKARLAAE